MFVAVLAIGVCAVLTNELTAFEPLLGLIDITGAIITADALHVPHRHADYLTGRGTPYVLMVKRNQLTLHRQLRGPYPGRRCARRGGPPCPAEPPRGTLFSPASFDASPLNLLVALYRRRVLSTATSKPGGE
jgi:hypothetical protein